MESADRIIFKKPELSELTRQSTVVDLHFHTRYSDGVDTVEAVAERAAKLGIGIAITDHNQIQGAVEMDRFTDVLSIPGIEVTSREGTHLLVYFYDIESLQRFYSDHVQPFMGRHVMSSIALGMEECIERARRFRTVVIFPHPYCAAYTGIHNRNFSEPRRNRLYEAIDGVEVINAFNLKRWNRKSALLGFNLNKAMTGGSDGHALDHMGRVVSYADCPRGREPFLDAIAARETRVIGKEMTLIRKVTSNSVKFKINICNCPDLVEKNLRYSYKILNLKSKSVRRSVRRGFNGTLERLRSGA